MADGFRLKAKHNLDEVLATMDAYAAAVQDIARPLALNRLGEYARVTGQRAIRKEYGLTIEQLGRFMSVRLATSGALEFALIAVGKGFPLSLFKPLRTAKGYSFMLKGRRVLVPHSFMLGVVQFDTEAGGGGGQVFARGTYNAGVGVGSGTTGLKAGKRRKRGIRETTGRSAFSATGERFGRFAFGRNRFPITMLRSTSPPSALLNPDVVDAMNERIKQQAPATMKNAIKFATTGR